MRDVCFTENDDCPEYRKSLEELAKTKGPEFLNEMLREVDPASADAIHPNNVKRTIRALEFYHLTKMPISEHNETEAKRERAYHACYFVLNDDRDRLYEKIEKRVDVMMQDGLLDEVKRLRDMGCKRDMTAMQGLGYKEILDHLNGDCTLEEAVARIKLSTRHFAKRQLTWFRREKDVIWINKPDFHYDENLMLSEMIKILKEQGIIEG